MAPSHSRQLLTITVPLALLLSCYLWFKRKRIGPQSDPGDNKTFEEPINEKSLQQELEEAAQDITPVGSPTRSLSRSLSGVEATPPIDIIIPRELRSHKTSPIIISDEDLDLEIEKIKSMKTTVEPYTISTKLSDLVDGPHKSPSTSSHSPKQLEETPVKAKKTTNATMSKPKLDFNIAKPKSSKTTPKKMAQKERDIVKVEEKLESLKLHTKDTKKGKPVKVENDSEEQQRQSSERDSANHSPADVMLASPSLSSISDNHSEGSSDSGKGGSDVATPPSRTPAGDSSIPGDVNAPTIYEFIIPQSLVGKLIGRYGSFVTDIKDKTRAHIIIKKHPNNSKLKVCAVEGTQKEIDKALKMIRDKFPLKRHPEITLEQVQFLPAMPNVPLTPDHLYLKLVEGINNDSIISCMVTPGHLFLQQPTHPSFPSLQVLSSCMNVCYSSAADSPVLPKPIQENTICVAESVGEWYRAMVLSTDEETDQSYVMFMDYGGYAFVENSKLKQIRGDFLLLPFQAAECVLANIRPIGGDEVGWSEEAYTLVADLTKGALTLTQIAEYTETGVPLVLMYILVGPQEVIYLNEELVKRGYAEYVSYQPTETLPETEGAVGGILADNISLSASSGEE